MTHELLKQNQRLYEKNLALFAIDNPIEAYRLPEQENSLKLIKSYADEWNLVNTESGSWNTLYQQEGALDEAKTWFSNLFNELNKGPIDTLFVYGVGLGYYYLATKDWLKEDKKRSLVFIEDDPRIIFYFLHMPLAKEILSHPQVSIYLYPFLKSDHDRWTTMRLMAAPVIWKYMFSKPYVGSLLSYNFFNFDFFHHFSAQWHLTLSNERSRTHDYILRKNIALENFYNNILFVDESIMGSKVYGELEGIPAIICGAGPSIDTQLTTIRKMKQKAFVIVAGSGMNVLTHAQIMPHLSGGVDPHKEQLSRQFTGFGFDVPIFYQSRFYFRALSQYHGLKLYNSRGLDLDFVDWFDEKLGIEPDPRLISGKSAANHMVELAIRFGCNPIILAGVDLAYTDKKRYAEGVRAHPQDEDYIHKNITRIDENLVEVEGIGGGKVATKRYWFDEAACFAASVLRNPQVSIVNATKEGFNILGIPNIDLNQLVEAMSGISWDLQGWLHGAIQNASKFKVKVDPLDVMEEWSQSVHRSIEFLKDAKKALLKQRSNGKSIYTGKVVLLLEELHKEIAYKNLIYKLDIAYDVFHLKETDAFKRMRKGKSLWSKKIRHESHRFSWLLQHLKMHVKYMHHAVKNYLKIKRKLSIVSKNAIFLKENPKPVELWECYPEGKKGEKKILRHYPNGKAKIEAYYYKGMLHGPWSVFSEEGKLLYRSWFFEDKIIGKVLAYYLDGALYSMQEYSDGNPDGQHLYYYPNGILKSFEEYKHGVLHGTTRLYYSNGALKREQHFVEGKLKGLERMWDETGKLEKKYTYE